MAGKKTYAVPLDQLSKKDVAQVGGKNASLGEMIRSLKRKKIRVPAGFATTARAYRRFLEDNDISDEIRSHIHDFQKGSRSLEKTGSDIRRVFRRSAFPEEVRQAIEDQYKKLSRSHKSREVDVAVRSSATSEDLPEASFAGQQETFLNVTGVNDLIDACRKCYASLFTDRAISYREEQGFDHMKAALSVGVQKMVRSDQAGAGVMFSIDTETGFPHVVVINAAWGLGENVVQGSVTPDEYVAFKPLLKDEELRPIIAKTCGDKEKKMVYARGGSHTTKNINTSKKERTGFVLNDDEILTLSRWAAVIEEHYQQPMDMEWAKDGKTGDLFIVQARPETVQSRKEAGVLKAYRLKKKSRVRCKGLSIGEAIASGSAQVIKSVDEIDKFKDDAVLITGMTDPDWVPIMKKASGIVTEQGGRTSHAAIVSRELGIPAVVGTGDATEKISTGDEITISCAEGDEGMVYEGILDYEEKEIDVTRVPETETRIMMNIASPPAAFRWWRLPAQGIGLARMEFIINNIIKIHPLALVHYEDLEDRDAKQEIRNLTSRYEDKSEYFVDQLARGIARIAAAQYPEPVIVRMSDFKTNEYANLIGGKAFEPEEDNPMIGFRGASRYYSNEYREGFDLECRAVKRVREEIGLSNVVVMIPFCRTLEEADQVLDTLKDNGLSRDQREKRPLQIYVMGEIPSNVILAEEFAQKFDGISIGTNDLTQLVLGIGRDCDRLSYLFDARNEAVKRAVSELIKRAHKHRCKVGICGQAPSDHPDFAEFLVRAGIDSISLNPDSIIEVKERVAKLERKTK
ncbi:MAG: phosphoenolpyruvate synthase [Candidatus Omnitrophota bacterium]